MLSAELSSGNEIVVRRAVAVPPGAKVPAAVVAQLSTVHIVIDPTSFVTGPVDTGTVKATIGGKTWDVALIQNNGIWKVTATFPSRP
jgi:hypothetical protein